MTVTEILVFSKRMGMSYRINRFYEYVVDMDMDIDTHQYNMVFGNPGSVYTGIFNKYDPIWIYINDEWILHGMIDETQYIWDLDGNAIRVVGRCILSPLVDNDVLPSTKYNIKPAEYIGSTLSSYGINKYKIDGDMQIMKKLALGTSESEISVIRNMVDANNLRMWTMADTVYIGKWNTDAEPIYYATRGLPQDKSGIPIKSLGIRDSGQDIIGEYISYKTDGDGNKAVNTYKNDKMSIGQIRKRKTSSINEDTETGIVKNHALDAERFVKEVFMNSIELTLDIKTGDKPILFNNCIHVIDTVTRINSIFFVRGVAYKKDMGGSSTTLTCVPSDRTLNTLWNEYGTPNGYICGTKDTSVDALINNIK